MATILIVDDARSTLRALEVILKREGYTVLTAASGPEGLTHIEHHEVDLLLCDVKMPVHDGIWLTEQVRARWPETAVIMASSALDMETVMRMRKEGAVDYVTKPFGREMLRQALQRATQA